MNEVLQEIPVERKIKGYKRSIVGLIPEDWKVERFKDITSVLRCGIASTPTYVDDGVPFLSSQNVKENKIILNKFNHISQEFHEKLTKKDKPQRGDILYTRVGASFGKAAVVDFDWEFSVYVSLTLIRMKKGYNDYFYSYLLNSDKYVNLARRIVFQGGGVQNLNVKEVEKFNMVVPPLEEQKKITSILSTWDEAIALKENMIEQKKEQKKGLKQKLLTGKVRLPNFENKWENRLISKCLNIMNGFPFKSNFFNEDMNGIPLIRIRDIRATELKTYYSGPYSEEYIISTGDVLIGMDGDFNITMWDKSQGLLNQRVMKITPKSGYDLYFLYQLLIPELKRLEHITPQTTVKHLSNKDINRLKIKMPSLKEQQAIGKILYTMDNEIFNYEKEVEFLKLQKQGLMQNLLTGKVRVKA